MGMTEKACDAWRRALELAPDYRPAADKVEGTCGDTDRVDREGEQE
jgi:hypothetical protein